MTNANIAVLSGNNPKLPHPHTHTLKCKASAQAVNRSIDSLAGTTNAETQNKKG